MTYKPCRVTFEGVRYEISRIGEVRRIWPAPDDSATQNADLAARIRAEAARQRRNRNARERDDVRRSPW